MIPNWLYGTAWKEDDTARLVREALTAGFRGFDTANQRKHYVEAAVGEAIAETLERGQLQRDDLFLQTKFTYVRGQDHRLPYDPRAPLAEQVAQSFASSLEHLQTERIDSYLLHGPSQRHGLGDDDLEVWRAMETLVDDGRVTHLGISNVNAEQVASLCREARIAPTFVQNRCYAATGWDGAVRRVCREHDLTYQGFSLLTANRHAWTHPVTTELARAHGVSPATVLFRFAQSLRILPITGTTDPQHMRDDLAAHELVLRHEEIERLTHVR